MSFPVQEQLQDTSEKCNTTEADGFPGGPHHVLGGGSPAGCPRLDVQQLLFWFVE